MGTTAAMGFPLLVTTAGLPDLATSSTTALALFARSRMLTVGTTTSKKECTDNRRTPTVDTEAGPNGQTRGNPPTSSRSNALQTGRSRETCVGRASRYE